MPVTYILRDNAILFRTTAYSEVGTFACDSEVAFEVDDIDIGDHSGQSVVVRGRAEAVEDPRELRRSGMLANPSRGPVDADIGTSGLS